MAARVKKHYDVEAPFWDIVMGGKKKFLKRIAPLLKLIKKHKKTTILDAGCGSGVYGAFFASEGFKVTFLDISEKMIQEAKKNAKPYKNVKFKAGKMEDFKSSKKFGVVWASSSLHNMPLSSLKKALKALFDVLEKNGILAIVMRFGTFEGEKAGQFGEKVYYRYSNPVEIKNLLKPYGLKWELTKYSVYRGNRYFMIIFTKP